jgi:DnaJ-class molecular chaperone
LSSCEPCKGSGAKPGTSPTVCPQCDGRGNVRVQQGFFTLQQTCPQCRGAGQTINDPCQSCSGQGRVQKQRTISIKIPAGVKHKFEWGGWWSQNESHWTDLTAMRCIRPPAAGRGTAC